MASVEDGRFGVKCERVHSFSNEWCTDYELDDESDLGVAYCASDGLESWILAHFFGLRFLLMLLSARIESAKVGNAMMMKS
jgi:hypothetical protein